MNNNTSYETQAIDLSLLSVLDITKEGKVVSAEKWVELWTLVFQHINKIDTFCVDMQATLDNWHIAEEALTELSKDMQMKYASLSTGFTHYGEAPPQNPHINFWVRRMKDIAPHRLLTDADIDISFSPKSSNAQSGTAVAEAVMQIEAKAELAYSIASGVLGDVDEAKSKSTEAYEAAYGAIDMSNEALSIAQETSAKLQDVYNGKWRDIADITLTEDAMPIISKDAEGNAFKLKEFRIAVYTTIPKNWSYRTLWLRCVLEGNAGYPGMAYCDNLYSGMTSAAYFYGSQCPYWEIYTNREYTDMFLCGVQHFKRIENGNIIERSGNITEIMLAYEWEKALPSGTRVVVQGVDADEKV